MDVVVAVVLHQFFLSISLSCFYNVSKLPKLLERRLQLDIAKSHFTVPPELRLIPFMIPSSGVVIFWLYFMSHVRCC